MSDTTTLQHRGLTFLVRTEPDLDAGPPWENCDGHGRVTGWEPLDAGLDPARYRLLSEDRHAARYYDFTESLRIALRDKWGVSDEEYAKLKAERTDGGEPTPEQITYRAVVRDYEYLRAWCQDEWEYIGVIVELRGAEGLTPSQSLWGIESNDTAYIQEVAQQLADQSIEDAGSALETAMYKLRELQENVNAAVLDRKDGKP